MITYRRTLFGIGETLFDPLAALTDTVLEERDRIARLWAKRLRAELHEVELPGSDVRAPMLKIVDELGRLLRDRGEDALWLWPESLRIHALRRFDQRFDSEDIARELKALHQVLLRVHARRIGRLDPESAEIIAELIGEASASMHAAFGRVMRTEEVRFREAAVMESVLHHVDVGILLAEADGTVSYATPPVTKVIGLPVRAMVGAKPAEALGMVLSQVNARHADGSPFRVSDMPFLLALKERRPVRGTMTIDHFPDRQEVVVEMNATPLFEEGDERRGAERQPYGVIQTVADRTESARKTRELSKAYEELRWLNHRLLRRARHQAVGQLASGAAHALNNFLNVIRLRVTRLRKEFKVEHLDALERTVRNVGELVARLQEYTTETAEEHRVQSGIDSLVGEALELVRAELAHPGASVALDTRLEAGSAPVFVDVSLFRELLVNLLLGAQDRMPAGGKLTIETRVTPDGNVVLTVEDSGRRLSAEELALLVDPFQAALAPQLSLFFSVGKRQVEQWGGSLECANKGEGDGVRCELRLPVAQAEAEVAGEKARAAEAQEAKTRVDRSRIPGCGKVLVVDDDVENAQVMADVLREEGYAVSVAHDGDVALKLWEAECFDAALLDVVMPDISGWDLARRIRERSPQAALAMVTGADVRGQSRESLAQVDAVFRKPVEIAALDEFLSHVPTAGPH